MGHSKDLHIADAEALAIAAEEQDIPFVEEAHSMSKQLTYVPASQPGPHYIESGKRPDCLACLAQYKGSVMAAQYYSTTDNFRDVAGTIITPDCWWHLPQPVPATELEWFEKTIFDAEESPYFWAGGNCMLYINGSASKFYATSAQAVTAAHDHWVAAGRP